ncbi:MAG TPA: ABC transporter permease subunit [Acidimicrobiales bacterium]|nr:ABC transporter permease subunit [Acidimicrobiales bacterium]
MAASVLAPARPREVRAAVERPPVRRRPARRAGGDGAAVFNHRILPYLLVLPQLAVVGVFFLWPTVRATTEAFERSNAFGLGTRFSGLSNFVSALTNGNYTQAIEVSLIFAASTTFLAMAIGLFLAAEVEQLGRARAVYRTLFIWTYAVPGAIAGALWLFLFQPELGPGARFLGLLGIKWNFALHGAQALSLVIALTVWQQSAYNFLFFTAALQGVPVAVHEAAAIDGAGPLDRFWRITFPLLSPTTFFLSVMDLLYALFSSFAVIDVVTQGGPAGATTTLVYQLYEDGFQNADSGLAGAETIVLIGIAALLTVAQFRLLNRRVHYR